jgi:hypothetical protein
LFPGGDGSRRSTGAPGFAKTKTTIAGTLGANQPQDLAGVAVDETGKNFVGAVVEGVGALLGADTLFLW